MTPQELAEQYADVEYGVGSRTFPEARRFWEGGVTDFLAGYNKAIEQQKEEIAALREKVTQLNSTIDYYEERKVKMQEEIDQLKDLKK